MFKYYSIIVLCSLLLFAISCERGDATTIKGEISNLDNSYLLSSYLVSDSLVIDTVAVNNKGKFAYNVNVDTLTTFSIYINQFEGSAVVFADKGDNITVKGDALLPDLIQVSGNSINDDLTSFKKENRELLEQRGQLMLNLRLDMELEPEGGNGSNSLSINEEATNLNLLNHELLLSAEEYIKENPDKLSSLILINNFFMNSDNAAALERVLGYIEGDVANTDIARRLSSHSDKLNRSAEGAQIPYFQLTDTDSLNIRSSDYRGKYLLLSFVSGYGTESRENIELLKNEYEELNKDSIEFVSVYIDSDIYPIEYIEQDSIPWTVVAEERGWGSDIVENLNVQYVPFNLLVAPDGTIALRNVPAPDVSFEVGKSLEE